MDALLVMAADMLDTHTLEAAKSAGIKRARTAMQEIMADYSTSAGAIASMTHHIGIWDDLCTSAVEENQWTTVVYSKWAMLSMRENLRAAETIKEMLGS